MGISVDEQIPKHANVAQTDRRLSSTDRNARTSKLIKAARLWFARRRHNASSNEMVFAIIDRSGSFCLTLENELVALGFDRQTAHVNVSGDAAQSPFSINCFRDTGGDTEISVYTAQPAAFAASPSAAQDKALLATLPVYAAADVLILCLSNASTLPGEQLESDLLDLAFADQLLSLTDAHVKQVLIVNPRNEPTLPVVADQIDSMNLSHGGKITFALPAATLEIQLNGAISHIFSFVDAQNLVQDRPIEMGVPNQSQNDSTRAETPAQQPSTEVEIERATYEAMIRCGARRVSLHDGSQPLLVTDDVVDASRDWQSFDERISLQLAAFDEGSVRTLTLKLDDAVFALNASERFPGLMISSLWASDSVDLASRISTLITSIESAFDLLRAQERT